VMPETYESAYPNASFHSVLAVNRKTR